LASKLLIIIATGDREKALTAMMYSNNAITKGGFEDVKILFFGPSEQLVAEDDEIKCRARDLAAATECYACKAISDRGSISDDFDKIGVKVEYVGTIISGFLKDGYIPMVW
jgi:hypothetical protein